MATERQVTKATLLIAAYLRTRPKSMPQASRPYITNNGLQKTVRRDRLRALDKHAARSLIRELKAWK